MNHEPREPFASTNEAKRFPPAIVLSVVVNLLFLTGAATILRERTVSAPTSGETAYITLEQIEARVVEQPRRSERNYSLEKLSPPPSVIREEIPTPVRERVQQVVPETESNPIPPKQPDMIRLPRTVTDEPQQATDGPPPPPPVPAVPDAPEESRGAEIEGAAIAASNAFFGDSPAIPSESGKGTAPPSGVPTASPAASPTPGPVAAAVPAGVTRSAELAHQELPRLPDALRESGYRSFVRVAVEVLEDGSFTVAIRTSSGNPDIDARVLDALKRWKWKPALENGVAVTSTQLFRFDFDVD